MSNNKTQMIDLIPFHPVPSHEELELIEVGRSLTEVQSLCVGRGASRDVYTLQHDPNNYVIKVLHDRRNSREKYGNQNFTEIQTYLSYGRIRKWLPHVASFDPVAYRWIVSERCLLDGSRVWAQIAQYRKSLLSMVTLRLKEYGATLEQINWLAREVNNRRDKHIRESHQSLIKLMRRSPLARYAIDIYADNNYNGKLFIDCLWSHLEVDELKTNRYIKESRKNRLERPISSWEILVRIVCTCHPLVCDLAIEAVDRNVRFSDLHEGNIGISLNGKKYMDLRLVDVGLTRRKNQGERLTPSDLILPPESVLLQVLNDSMASASTVKR